MKNKVKGAKISVLGLGVRGKVEDSRLSLTYDVVKELLKHGCKVIVHDPYIHEDNYLSKKVKLTKDLSKSILDADLIFISSDHKMYSKLNKKSFSKSKKSLLVFDGQNILNKDNFKKDSLLTIGMRN